MAITIMPLGDSITSVSGSSDGSGYRGPLWFDLSQGGNAFDFVGAYQGGPTSLPDRDHEGVPYEQAANRLGSWSGLMAQAGHASPPDAFVPGDVKTAQMFVRHFAEILRRVVAAADVESTLEGAA